MTIIDYFRPHNELYHHGVKGMRWGVRRYQNKDGTLTAAGRNRYDVKTKSIEANGMGRKEFLSVIDSGRDFVVSKNQTVYRSTTCANEIMVGKKYVSLRQSDTAIYNNMVADLQSSKTVYDKQYAVKKDMNVAGLRTQATALQDLYGKKLRTDPAFSYLMKSGKVDLDTLNKPISKMTDKELSKYLYTNPHGYDFDILNKSITDRKTKQYIDYLSKKGYDAVVDMVDWASGYADGPVVVLDANKTLKTKLDRVY